MVIEWADTIKPYLPKERLDVKFLLSDGDENKRVLLITPHGQQYEELCEAVL